jgi:hypothetical protein
MTDSAGRFTERAMTTAMHTIADQLNMTSDDARLLRLTNNAVFELPTAGVVIRIARSYGLRDRVTKVVRLGTWFEQIDGPTIRLAGQVEQPITVGELAASVWQYLPQTGDPLTPTDLGHVLREFHRCGVPPFELPAWDPIGDARTRIADAEALTDHDRDTLLTWCDALQPAVSNLLHGADGQLVHGDAHIGNLLRDDSGRVVFCDFDATSVGPWQVDLVAVPVGEARFGRPGAHEALAASYGYDVTTDPNWPTLRDARELKMIVAAVPLLASGPRIATEFTRRLQSITDDNHHARWTPYADLR